MWFFVSSDEHRPPTPLLLELVGPVEEQEQTRFTFGRKKKVTRDGQNFSKRNKALSGVGFQKNDDSTTNKNKTKGNILSSDAFVAGWKAILVSGLVAEWWWGGRTILLELGWDGRMAALCLHFTIGVDDI